MNTIIRDAGALNSEISKAIAGYKQSHKDLHLVVVSALAMCAEHGQPDPLNRIYDGLYSNDRNALRFYVKKIHVYIGNGGAIPADNIEESVLSAMADLGAVLTFEKGKFVVINNSSAPQVKDNKAALVVMADTILLAGEKPFLPFSQSNNFQSVKQYGDAEAIAALLAVRNIIEGGNTKSKNVTVSNRVKEMILKATDGLEATFDQIKAAAPIGEAAQPQPVTIQ